MTDSTPLVTLVLRGWSLFFQDVSQSVISPLLLGHLAEAHLHCILQYSIGPASMISNLAQATERSALRPTESRAKR